MDSKRRNLLLGALLVLGIAVPVVLAVEATRPSVCDHACLLTFTNSYLDAMLAHKLSAVKTAPDFHATENGRPVSLGEGVWKTAAAVPSRDSFADESSGQTGFFGVVADEQGQSSRIALRLTIKGGRIQTVDTLVSRGGA
jgi:hypothetical protein